MIIVGYYDGPRVTRAFHIAAPMVL